MQLDDELFLIAVFMDELKSDDPIPNIRFNVAKMHSVLPHHALLTAELIPLLRDDPNGLILLDDAVKPSLLRLKDSSDGDVRYFASRAIQAFQNSQTHRLRREMKKLLVSA